MVTNRNKQVGNRFESKFCELMFDEGFWVHNMAMNQAGQPADVIAVKNNQAFLIDCKVCERNTFPLSRIEENQHLSMELWKESGNGEGWFALKVNDSIYMLPHYTLITLAKEKSVLNIKDIVEYGTDFRKWVKNCS